MPQWGLEPRCGFSDFARVRAATWRPAAQTAHAKEESPSYAKVMREEWAFRFFICLVGLFPVVLVAILLFKL